MREFLGAGSIRQLHTLFILISSVLLLLLFFLFCIIYLCVECLYGLSLRVCLRVRGRVCIWHKRHDIRRVVKINTEIIKISKTSAKYLFSSLRRIRLCQAYRKLVVCATVLHRMDIVLMSRRSLQRYSSCVNGQLEFYWQRQVCEWDVVIADRQNRISEAHSYDHNQWKKKHHPVAMIDGGLSPCFNKSCFQCITIVLVCVCSRWALICAYCVFTNFVRRWERFGWTTVCPKFV